MDMERVMGLNLDLDVMADVFVGQVTEDVLAKQVRCSFPGSVRGVSNPTVDTPRPRRRFDVIVPAARNDHP